MLNLNVPSLPREQIKGIRWARLAAFGAVRAAIVPAESDGHLQIELRAVDDQLPPDTDTALLRDGFATLTTIVGIAEAWPETLVQPEIAEQPVPGAPFDAVHAIPDAADSRTLHSREHA